MDETEQRYKAQVRALGCPSRYTEEDTTKIRGAPQDKWWPYPRVRRLRLHVAAFPERIKQHATNRATSFISPQPWSKLVSVHSRRPARHRGPWKELAPARLHGSAVLVQTLEVERTTKEKFHPQAGHLPAPSLAAGGRRDDFLVELKGWFTS